MNGKSVTMDYIKKVPKFRCKYDRCMIMGRFQSGRAVKTRILEHKKAVHIFDTNSKIAQHVYQYNHDMDFDNVEMISRANNYHKRLFLEAWYSQRDQNTGNDHVYVLDICASFTLLPKFFDF